MPGLPFILRRPALLAWGIVVDRDRPDLRRLASIDDPEAFVWAILPHAARTFSACIALLPKRAAIAAAIGYLYCRMLDTYEDLLADAEERDESLRRFALRFEEDGRGEQGSQLGPATGGAADESPRTKTRPATASVPRQLPAAPAIRQDEARGPRDAGHLLLVERHGLVDRAYVGLEPTVRHLIRTLVRDMAAGMRWSSAIFVEQGGVLIDRPQLARYCREVLGHPVLFASRLLRWHQTGDPELPGRVEEQAMAVGEMIQLANVTRDIEKDLARGIGYHPGLKNDLGRDDPAVDPELAERIRRVRQELLVMALERAPAYRQLIEFLSPRLSMARASGVLMLLFTDRYFRSCAEWAGLPAWPGRESGARLILAALPAVWSPRWARRLMAEIERDFLRVAATA